MNRNVKANRVGVDLTNTFLQSVLNEKSGTQSSGFRFMNLR